MSEFLENLKKAADTGDFNSEAAKKILEISQLADAKIGRGTSEDIENLKETLEKRIETMDAGKERKVLTEEEVLEANSKFEKKMEQIKKFDMVNSQLATLIEIEDIVKASIEDMFSFTDELESKFEKEFEAEDQLFGELSQKIESIKSKYSSIINN